MTKKDGQTFTQSVHGIEETQQFASQLAEMIQNQLATDDSLTICLTGTLGAGKTTFVRALCKSFEVNEEEVSSPTFSLHQRYTGRNGLSINHFDFYRFEDEDQIFEIGFEETVTQPGLHLIEWGEKFARCLPESFWKLKIEVLGEQDRKFKLQEQH